MNTYNSQKRKQLMLVPVCPGQHVYFIEQHDGYLQLSEEEAAHAGSSVPRTACVLLEYGADKEGYWNSEQFMSNVADAVAIAEFKYPHRRIPLSSFLTRAVAIRLTWKMPSTQAE